MCAHTLVHVCEHLHINCTFKELVSLSGGAAADAEAMDVEGASAAESASSSPPAADEEHGLARGEQGAAALATGVTIPAHMIRFVHLNAHATTLLVCYWPHDDRERIRNVWIHTNPDDTANTLKLYNALRRLIFVDDDNADFRLYGFAPYCSAYMKMKLHTKQDSPNFERTPIGRKWDWKYVILDEESINVFEPDDHEVVDEWFKFQIETDGRSTEKIYFHGPMGFVRPRSHSLR